LAIPLREALRRQLPVADSMIAKAVGYNSALNCRPSPHPVCIAPGGLSRFRTDFLGPR
jgi:hypothetical protein